MRGHLQEFGFVVAALGCGLFFAASARAVLPSPEELASAKETQTPEERLHAFAQLAEAPTLGPEYRAVLRDALADADDRIRLYAALGLSATGQHDEAVTREILDAFALPTAWFGTGEEMIACQALVAQGVRAAPVLKDALRHDLPKGRMYALLVIADIGPSMREVLPEVQAAGRTPDEGLASLAAFVEWRLEGDDRKAVERLVPMLKNERGRKPGGAADQLAKMGPAAGEALPALIEAMNAHHDASVVEALDDLYPHFPAQVQPALKGALDEPKLADRAAAGLQRREGSHDYLLPHLVRMMNAEECLVIERHYLAQMLATYGADAAPATPGLIRELRSPSEQVRIDAAIALGAIGPAAEAALPALRGAENDPAVRSAATTAIARIEGKK
jgi:HEAT repeat protein